MRADDRPILVQMAPPGKVVKDLNRYLLHGDDTNQEILPPGKPIPPEAKLRLEDGKTYCDRDAALWWLEKEGRYCKRRATDPANQDSAGALARFAKLQAAFTLLSDNPDTVTTPLDVTTDLAHDPIPLGPDGKPVAPPVEESVFAR